MLILLSLGYYSNCNDHDEGMLYTQNVMPIVSLVGQIIGLVGPSTLRRYTSLGHCFIKLGISLISLSAMSYCMCFEAEDSDSDSFWMQPSSDSVRNQSLSSP